MKTVVISQPMLFPWVGFFEQLALADVYIHLDDVQFSKGSFVNRVQVRAEDGSRWMTVPLKGRSLSTTIRDLTADDDVDWRAKHLDLLARSYAESEHGAAMLGIARGLFDSYEGHLAPWLGQSLEALTSILVPNPPQYLSVADLDIPGSGWPRVLALVKAVGGDRYVSGHGAARYMDSTAFESEGVSVEYMDYAMKPYPQRYGLFTPYVTALDLLANTGELAPSYLRPRTVGWREFESRINSEVRPTRR